MSYAKQRWWSSTRAGYYKGRQQARRILNMHNTTGIPGLVPILIHNALVGVKGYFRDAATLGYKSQFGKGFKAGYLSISGAPMPKL